ncbi:peptide/nickel transport system substrate-binding protein [Paracoccus alcaliphilus]|uniref:Peptide/nickel transport system substrate-binding protein n=1 Tax=Paracoccus alcaliphilus TaxID=34002 RepID=A0A1H8MAS2_9RHOB|nr:ABC transporter substrate-binding protein [Paracoccus alcaliphilus]WCR20631.1 ABC transporter substrate-binding protein [Paracoccus alcaliphilus]SEO14502.1 peptide/nickel transport system substrate-binding protein [Paracoccus alcaliphilus]
MQNPLPFLPRSGLFASVLTLIASGALAETTVSAVMHSDLRVLDPVITTAHITRDHGYMIYDVLIAEDADGEIQPQMAEFEVSDDGLTYTFTLRDGLQFHDGAPVTGADVVASLERWGQRDTGGQTIMDVTASIEATDERTVVWTLNEPFGPLLATVGKPSGVPPFIMPQRIAETPADQAIQEHIGSGPFKFVPDEFQPGVGVSYLRNDDYVPRDEPASNYAGGKVVNVDKVRWITMSDSMTAVNALQSGDIDLIESMPVDLIPLLEGDDAVVVEKRAEFGFQTMGRLNFKHPPFDNQQIRQAALMAMSQEPILAALTASPEFYDLCGAIFGCGTRYEDATGTETLTAGGDPETAKKLLEEAGYDGTPVVLMQPTDGPTLRAQPVVAAQQLRAAGFNVDMQPMDWQTLVTRRASMDAPANGGWNVFFTNWQIAEIANPISNVMLNGRGDQGWFGWPEDPEIESLKQEFIAATTPEEQKAVTDRIQAHAMEFVTYIPLGEYNFPQARRTALDEMLPTASPVFWNLTKAE